MTELTAPPDTLVGEDGDLPIAYDPEPIRTTVEKMVTFHKRFVYHPDESTHDVAVLWSITTHLMDLWRWHGRLYVTAPQPQCGKTTQADLLGFFAYKPLPVASTSAAGLFRAISHWSPTVLLDEADNQFSTADDRRVLTAVVNEGAKRTGFVLRSERQRPVKHFVYGPLAFIGIDNGTLPEATQTRCIPIFMRRALNADVETFDPYDHDEYAAEVQWRMAEFIDKVRRVTPTFLVGGKPVTGRMRDIWTPLWSVAVALGGEWQDRVVAAAQIHQFSHVVSLEARILAATRDAFVDKPDDRMSSAALANYVSGYDDIPSTSPKALHASMKAYGVLPSKSNGTMTYWRRDLAPVWAEWLTT